MKEAPPEKCSYNQWAESASLDIQNAYYILQQRNKKYLQEHRGHNGNMLISAKHVLAGYPIDRPYMMTLYEFSEYINTSKIRVWTHHFTETSRWFRMKLFFKNLFL